MPYTPPLSPDVIFNFVTTPYTPPLSPDIVFEMTTDDDEGGGVSAEPRLVQIFVIT